MKIVEYACGGRRECVKHVFGAGDKVGLARRFLFSSSYTNQKLKETAWRPVSFNLTGDVIQTSCDPHIWGVDLKMIGERGKKSRYRMDRGVSKERRRMGGRRVRGFLSGSQMDAK